MRQQLEGHSPEKWVETIWQGNESKKEKRLIQLFAAVMQCNDSNMVVDVATVATQAFEKLEANKQAFSQKKLDRLEILNCEFKDKFKKTPRQPAARTQAQEMQDDFERIATLVVQSGNYKGDTLAEKFRAVLEEKNIQEYR